uniref:HTH CENPB-type domain-containing protein n=1 Tax=Scleropages formosus TaxID=113540 RepID=A0A8C9WRD6_SCLFO
MKGSRATFARESSLGAARRKKCGITLEEKLKIIRKFQGGQKQSAIAREMGYARSTVCTILKDRARIIESTKDRLVLKSKIITKKRQFPISEMEKLLTNWIEDMAEKQAALSLTMIQEKARSLYEDVKEKAGITEGRFIASHGWFLGYKKRANIDDIRVAGETGGCGGAAGAGAGAEELAGFPKALSEAIREGAYEGRSASAFKAANDRLALLLGGNAAGDFKLKPLAVYRAERPRALRNVVPSMLPVTWKSNPEASVTLALFEDWFNSHFIPQVKEYCFRKGIPFKVLLVLERAPRHPEELGDFHPDVKVVFLPPEESPLLQPVAQGVAASFKAYYLRRMFSQAIRVTEGDGGISLREFWNKYDILDAVKNIAAAWYEVKSTTMNGAWKSLCPGFVHGWKVFSDVEDTAEKCVELARQLRLAVSEEDVAQLLRSHGDKLSEEDLVELEAHVKEEEEMQDVDAPAAAKRFTVKGLAEAFHLIDAALAKIEAMDPNTERFESFRQSIFTDLSSYRAIYYEKQLAANHSTLGI